MLINYINCECYSSSKNLLAQLISQENIYAFLIKFNFATCSAISSNVLYIFNDIA